MERLSGTTLAEPRRSTADQVGCLIVRDPFVAVERRRDPQLAGRALAIGHPERLAIVSAEARAQGITPGARVTDLVAQCPEAAVVTGRIERYIDAAAIADEALWRLGLERAWDGLSECLFEPATGPRLPSGMRRVAEQAMAGIASTAGLQASCGLADTVVAARAAARLAEPHGLVQVLPGYDARFLAPLDVARLDGIDGPLARRLGELGLATIGRLASRAPEELRSVLGRAAGPLVTLARGLDTRGVSGRLAPVRLVRTAHLESGCATPAGVAAQLGADLAATLTEAGWQAARVTVRRYGARAVANHSTSPIYGADLCALESAVRRLAAVPVGFVVTAVSVVASRLMQIAASHRRPARPASNRQLDADRACVAV